MLCPGGGSQIGLVIQLAKGTTAPSTHKEIYPETSASDKTSGFILESILVEHFTAIDM